MSHAPDHGMQRKNKAEEGISSEGHTRLRITIGFIGNKAPFMMVSHQTKYTKRNEKNDGNGAAAQGTDCAMPKTAVCRHEDAPLLSRQHALAVTTTHCNRQGGQNAYVATTTPLPRSKRKKFT